MVRIAFLLAAAVWDADLKPGLLFPVTGVFVDTEKAFESQAQALLFPGFHETFRSVSTASLGPSFQGGLSLHLPRRFRAGLWGGYAEVRKPSAYQFEQEGTVGSPPFSSDVWVMDKDQVDVFALRFLGPKLSWASRLGPLGFGLSLASGWAHVRMSETYRNEARAQGFAKGNLASDWVANVRGLGWTLDTGTEFFWPRKGRWRAALSLGFQTVVVSRLRGAWSSATQGDGAFQSFTGSDQGDAVWSKLTDTDTGQSGYGIGDKASLGTSGNQVTEEAPFVAAGLRLDLGLSAEF